MDTAPVTSVCVACGGPLCFYGKRLEYEYHRCGHCGTIQLHPMPDEEDLRRRYASEYHDQEHICSDPAAQDNALAPLNKAVAGILARHLPTGADVAEIGSGWGSLCRQLRERYNVHGYELNAAMVAYCQKQGLPVQQGSFESLMPAACDAVVLVDVFEHLLDHAQALRRIHAALRPGGLFLSAQPTAELPAFLSALLRRGDRQKPLADLAGTFAPPWHTVLFTVPAMRAHVVKYGFTPVLATPAPFTNAPGVTGCLNRILTRVSRIAATLAGAQRSFAPTCIFVFQK